MKQKRRIKKEINIRKKMKKEKHFGKELIKQFLVTLLVVLLLLTGFLIIQYKNIMEKKENAFLARMEQIETDMQSAYTMMLVDQITDFKEEKTRQEFENRLLYCMSNQGTLTFHNWKEEYQFDEFSSYLYRRNDEWAETDFQFQKVNPHPEVVCYIECAPYDKVRKMNPIKHTYICNAENMAEEVEFTHKYEGSEPFWNRRSLILQWWGAYAFDKEAYGTYSLKQMYVNEDTLTYVPGDSVFYEATMDFEGTEEGIVKEINREVKEEELLQNGYRLVDFWAKYDPENPLFFYGHHIAGANPNSTSTKYLDEMTKDLLYSLNNDYSAHVDSVQWDNSFACGWNNLNREFQYMVTVNFVTHNSIEETPEQYVFFVSANFDIVKHYKKRVVLMYVLATLFSILFAMSFTKRICAKDAIRHNMMEYRKTLMDSMAHDLKSPLMAMSGYAENLKEQVHTEKREEYAEGILETVDYMNRIIGDCMELSKAEDYVGTVETKEVFFVDLLEQVEENFKEKIAEKNLTISVVGEGKVCCNEKMMLRVLDNLFGNAVKHSKNGSNIEVIFKDNSPVSYEKSKYTTINIIRKIKAKREQKNCKYIMQITNDYDKESIGKRIKASDLLKPFVKGDKNRSNESGSGLGLSIAKELLVTQGYQLKVEFGDGCFKATIK